MKVFKYLNAKLELRLDKSFVIFEYTSATNLKQFSDFP